jgi:hypothetical protein
MKRLIFLLMLVTSAGSAFGQSAGIAFQTDKNSIMEVTINGKRCNTTAKSFVRVAGNPGMYRVEIKVLNPNDKVWYVVRKETRVEKGYDYYYKLDFSQGKRPVLQLLKRYPTFYKDYSSPIQLPKPLIG